MKTDSGAPAASRTVVRVEHVGLRYDVPRERIDSIKEYAIRALQGRIGSDQFWALKDVTFDVETGEVFGIIGQNGAGKSSLLKLVARVLRPSTGRIWTRGKVAPLLSVGAGFHPELTGRENVFLNGTLLGFTRRQMEEKFKSIVDFSELGGFIELPVRSYSSGMAARLGFAVASDSKPDILIVDEALAVGDEAFQAKCFERIERYQAEGMTTFLVTHSSERIRKYCDRAAWLHKGEMQMIGPAGEVIDQYQAMIKPGERKHAERQLFGL